MESSSSASSGSQKRARAHGSLNQVPCCLVDGCMADLAKCRDYHRRHKVCEAHSKTPKVTIRGLEQRFCQQCSRFHSLGEFDEGKRSCRKRLDGHNRRRRKPQPDSVPLTHGRFLPSPQGSSFMAFSSSQVFPTTAVTSAWVDAEIQSQISFSSSSSRNSLIPAAGSSSDSNSKEEKAFPFLHGTASSLPCVPVTQPHFSSSSTTDRKMFSHGSTAMVNSTSALSLLSPHPAARPHIVEPHSSQSMINANLHYTALGMVSERVGSGAPASDAHMHEQAVLRGTSHGSAATASHHTLSFSWE